jgi:hypothetical protein
MIPKPLSSIGKGRDRKGLKLFFLWMGNPTTVAVPPQRLTQSVLNQILHQYQQRGRASISCSQAAAQERGLGGSASRLLRMVQDLSFNGLKLLASEFISWWTKMMVRVLSL